MVIKDKIVSWFVNNIVVPNVEKIDNPGFITIITTTGKEKFDIRELFLPEDLFNNLEKEIKTKFGKRGEHVLYSIGKKFGYVYSMLSSFPTIKNDKKSFLNFVYFLVRWVESTYASKVSHKVDYDNKVFHINMNNYIICRKNGIGYLLGSGGVAGIWSYMCCDKTIEGIETKCQGKGDKECKIICAPYDTLVNMKLKPFKFRDLESSVLDRDYLEINKVRQCQFTKNSLKNLIDARFFKYSRGVVNFDKERFFLCEASFMYILEKELKKLRGGNKILFDVAFDWAKKLAENQEKQYPYKFIMDFMPALGWGDILVSKKNEKYEVFVNYFPWTKWANDINFILFRGILSGFLTGFTGKNVKLKNIKTGLDNGFYLKILE